MAEAINPRVPDEATENLLQLVAKAADLCLQPWLHAVRSSGDGHDCVLLIEARDAGGQRCPEHDLELEIYSSGDALNLMLTALGDPAMPMLWHGSHPVWMDGASGERCARPSNGAALEALCRRLRALLSTDR